MAIERRTVPIAECDGCMESYDPAEDGVSADDIRDLAVADGWIYEPSTGRLWCSPECRKLGPWGERMFADSTAKEPIR
ncbi:hypothetical protein ACFY05_31820 [Microtetraspora fusca]|uniref:Uncharacterized protein n=1 Tax=Microtetraspora fusca TaxID=1997 RepID=A0ABW6VDM6_MICFU